ncbi:MAG: MMPL family transporter [Clostridia bacterium]|nr:MMPL family transporter [Clostridia bacterium]
MKNLSRFIVNNRLWIVIVFAVLLIASIVGMMFVEVNYNDSGYLPDDSSVAKGLDAMYGEFGEGGNATVMLSETTIEKAVEFKEWMESIDGVATVIWIDDIFLSDEIWVIKKAQESTDGVTRGKAVYFIMHMVNKLGSLNDAEMSAIEGVLGGGSLDMNALSGVLAKLNDGLSKSDQSLFLKFMLGMQSAVNDPNNPLQSMGGGFDIGMLDSFKPSLEMFYYNDAKRGEYALFQVAFTKSDYDTKTMDAIDTIKDGDGKISIVGNAATTYNSIQLVSKETMISTIVAAIIIIVILLLTTTSYLEPIAILIPIGVSVLMNMGTNWITPYLTGAGGVSYITQSVSAVLQLALTMDYCVTLLHRFKEEKKKGLKSNEAMVEALSSSFKAISSASITTVASFVALMFMKFKLGMDMGFVLMKGTILSILCVIFLMPAVILYMEKLLDKTEHKTFNLSWRKFSKGLVKSRFYVPFIIIAIIVPCIFLQGQNFFVYGPEASMGGTESEIAEDREDMEIVFGKQNQLIMLLPIEYYENGVELEITKELQKIDGIATVQSYSLFVEQGVESMMPEKFIKQFLAYGEDGSEYSRVVMFLDAEEESDSTTALVKEIQAVADKYLAENAEYGEGFVLGTSSATLAIKEIVNSDYDIISYVSLGLVALILLFTFKSAVLPIILVIVIQGSVYVNMAVPYITGLIQGEAQPIVFIGYMLISSILLGATVDYGILLTDRYMEHRRTMGKYDAVRQALADSSRTLITSAGILAGAGAAVQFVSTLPATKVIGAAIMRGGILSFLFVIILLPQLLILLDKAIRATTIGGKKKMIDSKTILVAPEIEEASVIQRPKDVNQVHFWQLRKKYRDMTSDEREDAILENILESIDNPEFDPDYEDE